MITKERRGQCWCLALENDIGDGCVVTVTTAGILVLCHIEVVVRDDVDARTVGRIIYTRVRINEIPEVTR